MIKRVSGTVIGVLLGILPLINLLAGAILSFVRRRRTLGFIMLAGAAITVFSVYMNVRRRNAEMARVAPFITGTTTRVQQLSLTAYKDTLQLQQEVRQAMQEAAKEYYAQTGRMSREITAAYNGSFSREGDRLFRIYLMKLIKLNNQPQNSNPTQEIKEATATFISSYKSSNETGSYPFFVALPMLLYFLGLVTCIYLYRSLFTQRSHITISDDNSTAESDQRDLKGDTSASPGYNDDFSDTAFTSHTAYSGTPVPVNQATEQELANLPGISIIQAKLIIKERADNGPFYSMGDFSSRVTTLTPRVETNLAGRLQF